MIEVLDLTGRDDGADSEHRVHPCAKRTWCILHRDHDGSCLEVPRAPIPPSDYGPKRKARA